MIATRRRAAIGLAATLLACSAGTTRTTELPTPTAATTLDALVADAVAERLTNSLLQSESRLQEPDSLFAPSAIIMADGETRASLPRLAGVGLGGTVQLVTSQVSSIGAFVWGVIEYRWIPMFEADAVRSGVATVIIAQLKDGSWRIVHLHSSSPPAMRGPAPSATMDDAGPPGGTINR